MAGSTARTARGGEELREPRGRERRQAAAEVVNVGVEQGVEGRSDAVGRCDEWHEVGDRQTVHRSCGRDRVGVRVRVWVGARGPKQQTSKQANDERP